MPDLLIIGAGLTGATIARLATDAGFSVEMIERRSVIGGNIRDELHPSGVYVGLYGPHYFRTNSDAIWAFARRFSEFRPFAAEVNSLIRGEYYRWPIQKSLLGNFTPKIGFAKNFEEACLQMMPREVYEDFVKGYTEKQWGVPATELDAELARRFEIREDSNRQLTKHKYQGLPAKGYSIWIEKILEGIPVTFGEDFSKAFSAKLVIYTGSIDEFYGFGFGKLRYRAQNRVFWDSNYIHPTCQTNYANPDEPAIRDIQWGSMWGITDGNLPITTEVPFSPQDPNNYEYPFPSKEDQLLYKTYEKWSKNLSNVIFAGRLGEYRYLDMDQAIARAMHKFETQIKPRLS